MIGMIITSNYLVYQKSGPLVEWIKKVEKCEKIDEGPQICQNYDNSKS